MAFHLFFVQKEKNCISYFVDDEVYVEEIPEG
jgi:hypothetical protein